MDSAESARTTLLEFAKQQGTEAARSRGRKLERGRCGAGRDRGQRRSAKQPHDRQTAAGWEYDWGIFEYQGRPTQTLVRDKRRKSYVLLTEKSRPALRCYIMEDLPAIAWIWG